MAKTISADVLLQVAERLFTETPRNKIDQIDSASVEEKREKRLDDFVKFYRRLRDKLEADEE